VSSSAESAKNERTARDNPARACANTFGHPHLGSKDYSLLQLNHEMVTVSWFADAPVDGTCRVFLNVHLLSITAGIWFYPVELMEIGEKVDGKKSQ
jgi:hypothetical protein